MVQRHVGFLLDFAPHGEAISCGGDPCLAVNFHGVRIEACQVGGDVVVEVECTFSGTEVDACPFTIKVVKVIKSGHFPSETGGTESELGIQAGVLVVFGIFDEVAEIIIADLAAKGGWEC